MSDSIIKVESLFKKYSRNAHDHLGYGMTDLIREITGSNSRELRKDEFYAVNDVSFELSPGDTFALIGRNGSGKTTVLKMLNGLIKPDGGRITMAGRVQALINLGAGFSPRLSGRENIFNSASLMGLNHQETSSLLDAIIDFSELEDFIDSPVGTYSSGMNARLGFSVAVHLQPDILLIDEILAVGDFSFQNKCYARMEELKRNGVTIVMVSHSHGKVIQMCDQALWLHEGQVRHQGSAQESVKAYLAFLEGLEQKKIQDAASSQRNTVATPAPAPTDTDRDKRDPEVRLAISEPSDPSNEIRLSPSQKQFKLSGWCVAPESKVIELILNGETVALDTGSRPDVEARFPEADCVLGFSTYIDRRDLESSNLLEIKIGNITYWSKQLITDDDQVSTEALAKSGLYGPVYHTEGLIEEIVCTMSVDGMDTQTIPIHSEVTITYSYRLLRPVHKLHMTLAFYRKDGMMISAIPTLENGLHRDISEGTVKGTIVIPDFNLVPGTYVLMMPVCDGKQYLVRDATLKFIVSGEGSLFWGASSFTCEHTVSNENRSTDSDRSTS